GDPPTPRLRAARAASVAAGGPGGGCGAAAALVRHLGDAGGGGEPDRRRRGERSRRRRRLRGRRGRAARPRRPHPAPADSLTGRRRRRTLAGMSLLREPILALSRSDRVRESLQRLPVTRGVVDRYVAGETTEDAVRVAAALVDQGLHVTL